MKEYKLNEKQMYDIRFRIHNMESVIKTLSKSLRNLHSYIDFSLKETE